jgi:hypothetical protein
MKRNDKVKGILNYNLITGDSLNYVNMVGATASGKIYYTSGGTEYEAQLGDTTTNLVLLSIVITGATSVKTGVTSNYTATGYYTNSSTANITTEVTWSVSNSNATIVAGTGVLSPVLSGTTIITATKTNEIEKVITASYNVTITL